MLNSRASHHRPGPGARAACCGLAVGVLVAAVCACGAAYADEPVGWESVKAVPGWHFFLVLLIIPAALAAVIAAVVALPSIIRGASYEDGEIWAGDDEWFGGPKDGSGPSVAAGSSAKQIEAAGEQGGAGARY